MLKVLKLTLILIILTSSISLAQKKRSKKERKKEKQEQLIEESEEVSEEEPLEEDIEEDDYGYDDEEEYDEENIDGENQDTIQSPSIKQGESAFKIKKGPSKVALLLERFQFNFSSGYGLTSWQSGRYNYGYFNQDDNQIDTSTVKYKGLGSNIPFHFQMLFDFGKVRLGGGTSYDFYFMKKLKPNAFENSLDVYNLKGTGSFKKFYGHLGYTYFENRLYGYLLDLEAGVYKGSPSVNTANNSMRPFVNLGITMERKYSEYFRMFLKPSLEYKTQPFELRDFDFPVNNHKMITFYVTWGISYSIPLVRKCPIRACGVRVHHYHGGRVFRGNPFQRLQNPNYGEEDRKFIRERGKNKRRMDPY
ncbi:MAG TPA: hypothetical protein VD908_13615 [Cytophagales bacterium]|nr:hypothetical protein [Cytophagales bacterium]